MTSQVKISAHCSDDKEVVVTIAGIIDHATGDAGIIEEFKLQSGETAERAIYDSRSISCAEVVKQQ